MAKHPSFLVEQARIDAARAAYAVGLRGSDLREYAEQEAVKAERDLMIAKRPDLDVYSLPGGRYAQHDPDDEDNELCDCVCVEETDHAQPNCEHCGGMGVILGWTGSDVPTRSVRVTLYRAGRAS